MANGRLSDIIRQISFLQAGGDQRGRQAETIGQVNSFANTIVGAADLIRKTADSKIKRKAAERKLAPATTIDAPRVQAELDKGTFLDREENRKRASEIALASQEKFGGMNIGEAEAAGLFRPEKGDEQDIVTVTAEEAAISRGRLKAGARLPKRAVSSVLSLGRAEAQGESAEQRQRRILKERAALQEESRISGDIRKFVANQDKIIDDILASPEEKRLAESKKRFAQENNRIPRTEIEERGFLQRLREGDPFGPATKVTVEEGQEPKVTIQGSDGQVITIPQRNLQKAFEQDPSLTIKGFK